MNLSVGQVPPVSSSRHFLWGRKRTSLHSLQRQQGEAVRRKSWKKKKPQQIGNSNPSPIYWHLTVPLHTWHLIWPQQRQMVGQEKKFLFCKWLDWVHPYGRWHHPYGRKQRRTKEPLNESERGEWKSWLKTQHSKNKIRVSGSITSWLIDRETMETVRNFIFLGSKITADGDCSQVIKRCLLLGRKAMTNLDSILKSRDITLPTKVHLDKAMVFPVVICGCESWTRKKAECRRMLLNCGVGEGSWESLGLNGDQTSQS